LYLPDEEMGEFVSRMSTWDLNLRCSANNCHYNQKCADVKQPNYFYLDWRLQDSTGKGNKYSIPVSKIFYVSGSEVGDTDDTCYMPVFPSKKNDNVWYVGNFFTSYFYLVFDQTPQEEHGKDYIQIGIGPRARTPLVGVSTD